MTISTKTNNTALSHLLIITNKTVKIIAMKIVSFVEVATLWHRREETGWFWRFYEGTAVIYENTERCDKWSE